MERGWRARAIREELFTARLIVVLVAGLCLIGVAIWIVDDVGLREAIGLAGLALIVLFVVFPFLTAASLGPGAFNFELAFAERKRSVEEVYGAYRTLLEHVAAELGGRPDVDPWVESALARAYPDSGLVPQQQRLRHVLCQLVDVVRQDTWREAPLRVMNRPGSAIELDELAALPFDQRAALVLTRSTGLSSQDCAAILHIEEVAVAPLVLAAEESLRIRPAAGSNGS